MSRAVAFCEDHGVQPRIELLQAMTSGMETPGPGGGETPLGLPQMKFERPTTKATFTGQADGGGPVQDDKPLQAPSMTFEKKKR
jgi:hypothetical protein